VFDYQNAGCAAGCAPVIRSLLFLGRHVMLLGSALLGGANPNHVCIHFDLLTHACKDTNIFSFTETLTA
jgi:hypothetical protein